METKKMLVVVLALCLLIFAGCDEEYRPNGPYDFLEGKITTFTTYPAGLKESRIPGDVFSNSSTTVRLGDPVLVLTVQVDGDIYVMEVRGYYNLNDIRTSQTTYGIIEALKDPERRALRFPTIYKSGKRSKELFSEFKIGIVFADSLGL